MRRLTFVLAIVLIMLATSRVARADVTAFVGTSTNPANRPLVGFSGGFGLIIVGFEIEYAHTSEDELEMVPALHTVSGNLLLQTPTRVQVYFTTGGGVYRERLGNQQETNLAVNTGGGVKLPLAGPLKFRIDYRVFKLKGSPLYSKTQRFYAGLNIAF